MTGYEPHDWIGVAGLAILAFGGLVTAWITARGAKKVAVGAAESADHIKGNSDKILNQVQNSHENNLRDDLDEVKALAEKILEKVVDHGAVLAVLDKRVERLERKTP